MSHENHPPSPSGSFARSASIEYPMPNSYPAHESGPNRSSVMVGISESHLPEHGQRTVAAHHVGGESPELSDVRPVVNSSNMITDSIGNRSWDQTGGQPQGFSDLGHQNNSGYAVATADGNSGAQPPSFSGAAQRDRSNNGGSDDTEPLNPLDYAGISLVGKKFKLVNPEAYYVEQDESPTDFPYI